MTTDPAYVLELIKYKNSQLENPIFFSTELIYIIFMKKEKVPNQHYKRYTYQACVYIKFMPHVHYLHHKQINGFLRLANA